MRIIKTLLLLIIGCFIFKCKNDNVSISDLEKNKESQIYAITVIPAENIHIVSPAMGGIIKSIFVKKLDTVNSGQIIASLYNPDYIDIQKEYLTIKYELDYLKEEFKRQGELSIENVTSIKRMQRAQANYFIKEVTYKSLEKKLRIIGLDPLCVSKKGPLKYVYLHSPADGVVSFLKISPGQFLDKNDSLICIQTNDSLYAKLFLDYSNYKKITPNSNFEFFIDGEKIAEAVLANNTVEYIDDKFVLSALIINNNSKLIRGMKLNTTIKKY